MSGDTLRAIATLYPDSQDKIVPTDEKGELQRDAAPLERYWRSGRFTSALCSVPTFFLFVAIFILPLVVNLIVVNERGGHNDLQRMARTWLWKLRGDVIPDLDDLKKSFSDAGGSPTLTVADVDIAQGCALNWTATFKTILSDANVELSQPQVAVEIFDQLFGTGWWPVLSRFKSYMQEPQNLTSFLDQVGSCASENIILGRIACAAKDNAAQQLSYASAADFASSLNEIVTYMMVLEALTAAAAAEAAFAVTVFERLNRRFENRGLERKGAFAGGFVEDGYRDVFVRDQYISAKSAVEEVLKDIKEREVDAARLEAMLQLDIVQAASTGVYAGFGDNGLAGLALGVEVDQKGPLASVTNDAALEVAAPWGKEWVDTYIAWAAVHVTGLQDATAAKRMGVRLAPLFIPSVVCAAGEGEDGGAGAGGFLERRVLSSFIHWNYEGNAETAGEFASDGSSAAATAAWGTIVAGAVPWPMPEGKDVKAMALAIQDAFRPTGLSLFSFVSDNDISFVVTIAIVAASLLAATALEALTSLIVLPGMTREQADSANWFTEMTYALWLWVALFAQSVWGIPFMILGMWRLGVPDISKMLLSAIDTEERVPLYRRGCLLTRALATDVHHACTAFIVTAVSVGYSTLTRDILAVVIPLSVQHLSAPLRHQSQLSWRVVIVMLELWFQFEAYYFLDNDQPVHEKVTLIIMLATHYALFVADGVELAFTGGKQGGA